ncbi:MAG: hypothetical protein J6D09_04800 [Clostridia bacterium]|nr:hypothetical protein [Clostridia bacterium]
MKSSSEAKNEIRELFLKNGFSEETFVIGTGKSHCKSENKFVFQAKGRKSIRERTAKYAVKYFSEYDFYILWKIKENVSYDRESYRQCLSISFDKAMEAYNSGKPARKGVNFEWCFKESVYVVDFDDLKVLINSLSKEIEK